MSMTGISGFHDGLRRGIAAAIGQRDARSVCANLITATHPPSEPTSVRRPRDSG